MSFFSDLGLAQPILKALEASGYDSPTPIQMQAIPPLLQGRDLCGIAQTGTGKTAAFALPSLHHFANNIKPRQPNSCRMLVLSPTRELAAQIADKFRDYGKYLGLTVQCVFGGMPIFTQKKKLQGGTDILVATPGRLLDLIDQRALTLKDVEIFVLDEADQMLDLGFIHALKRIDALLPKKRQSLFFSATMPKSIAELGNRFLDNPVRVSVAPQSTTAERVEQYVTFVNASEKQALLNHKLKTEEIDRALVFTRTKHGADRVVRHLAGAGIKAAAIHGNKSQGQRTAALQAFRAGQIRILVATDIAARGIDVPGVSHVFNYELPNVPEQYVHRIGRTARAGADGIAISFVADDERAYLKDIERLTKVRAMQVGLPEGFRALVAAMPKPVAPPRSEQQQRARPGYAGAKTGNRAGLDRNGETRERSKPRQGGWQPEAGPREERSSEQRPGGHKRGGPPVAGRDGQKRHYGPKKGGVGNFRGAVKRAG
jgi:ATP-dependent RNA helicase RhlE